MERVRALIPAGLAAALVLGTGCVHVHRDANGKLKSVEFKGSEAKAPDPAAPPTPPTGPKFDPAVKPAGATVPVPGSAFTPSLSKLIGAGGPKDAAGDFAVTWHNRLATLRNPVENGAPVSGLVGQMFLFGPGYQPAEANGKLSIEMFDETPRPGRAGPAPRLGSWTFDKKTLSRLMTMDERFGRSYALFLPWPDYTPDVTRVRLDTKYEPASGFALYAPASTVTIDTSTPGGPVNGGGGFSGPGPILLGGPANGAGGVAGPPAALPPLNPMPVGGALAKPAGGLTGAAPPPGLPPLVITPPSR